MEPVSIFGLKTLCIMMDNGLRIKDMAKVRQLTLKAVNMLATSKITYAMAKGHLIIMMAVFTSDFGRTI